MNTGLLFEKSEQVEAPVQAPCDMHKPFRSRMPFTPRDYQAKAMEDFWKLYKDESNGILARMATGTGKTPLACFLAERWISLGWNYKVIVLSYERGLVWQFAQEVEDFLGYPPGVEMGSRHVHEDDLPRVIVASRQSLYEREVDGKNVSRLHKFDNHKYNWLVVLDEAHRWLWKLKSCSHILEWFADNPKSIRIGLTATPFRGDKISLRDVFPNICADFPLDTMTDQPSAVSEGWAVKYDQRFVQVEGVDFRNLSEVRGDFDPDELASALEKHEAMMSLIKPTTDLVKGRRTLIFSPTVAMAKDVAATLNAEANDIVAHSLDGSSPDEHRKEIYERHKRGDFQFLSVCGLCREGYNDPSIGAVAIFRPTKSKSLAEQMKGRGCRPLKGLVDPFPTAEERLSAIAESTKPDCMIVDLVGVSGLGGAVSTAQILAEGKPDEVIERAEKNAIAKDGGSVDWKEEIENAEMELAEEAYDRKFHAQVRAHDARIRREEEARKRARIDVDVKYRSVSVNGGHGSRSARKQGRARMPFGKFAGQSIGTVPQWYIKGVIEKGWLDGIHPGGKDHYKYAWLWKDIVHEYNERGLGPKRNTYNTDDDLSLLMDDLYS